MKNATKNQILVVAIFVLLAGTFFSSLVQAQDLDQEIGSQLGAAAGASGAGYGPAKDPRVIIAYIIRATLSITGMVLVVMLMYAGFLWMTAGGDSEQVAKATGLIKNSIIGLIIIFAAYSITFAIVNLARGLPLDYGLGFRCVIPLAC